MDNFNGLSSGTDNGETKFCPLINHPEPDCYCFVMNSQATFLTLKYCRGNYLGCDIYQRVKKINDF